MIAPSKSWEIPQRSLRPTSSSTRSRVNETDLVRNTATEIVLRLGTYGEFDPDQVARRRSAHEKSPTASCINVSPQGLRQENDLPQPQLRWALGLSTLNPAPWMPSL